MLLSLRDFQTSYNDSHFHHTPSLSTLPSHFFCLDHVLWMQMADIAVQRVLSWTNLALKHDL